MEEKGLLFYDFGTQLRCTGTCFAAHATQFRATVCSPPSPKTTAQLPADARVRLPPPMVRGTRTERCLAASKAVSSNYAVITLLLLTARTALQWRHGCVSPPG